VDRAKGWLRRCGPHQAPDNVRWRKAAWAVRPNKRIRWADYWLMVLRCDPLAIALTCGGFGAER